MTTRQQERIQSLCSEFRLPTVAAEVVTRFQQAEHGKALGTLLEVFELEAGDRRQRREDRQSQQGGGHGSGDSGQGAAGRWTWGLRRAS